MRVAKYARWKGVGGCTAWRAGSFEFGAHALEGQPPDICKSLLSLADFRVFLFSAPYLPYGRECGQHATERDRHLPEKKSSLCSGGNHLSNTTCLRQVFFKRGEYFGRLW